MDILRPLERTDVFFGGLVIRRSKAIIGILSVILVVAIAVALFLVYQVRKSFPETSGTIGVARLEDRVDVYRDDFGVPVIHAGSEHDLMMALGFVHAQDRLWQMDLGRRAGEGRLSEIFGEVTVPFDKMFRIVGIKRIAEDVERSMSEQSRHRLQSYTDGVNAYLDHHKGRHSVEFDMLNYEPEPWAPLHTLIIAQMMAWELNMSWWVDVTLGAVAERVGLEKALDVFPTYPTDVPPIVPRNPSRYVAGAGTEFLRVAQSYHEFFGHHGISGGSNAWVVSPKKSASGKVILGNDTHLHLQIPSKWYELHARAPGYDVGGMSIPGVPGVVIGHNPHIAWGVTNAMTDEADFYVEQIDSADTTRYWFDGRWVPMRFQEEEILVKDGSPVRFVVRSTHHGSVVTDIRTMLQKASPPFVATMRWTGAELCDRVEVFNKINRARNWQEFVGALKKFTGPGQNFVYGDKEGNIGYWCGVLLPLRGVQSSTLPLPGWDKSSEWKGFVPFEQLPHQYNPPEGYIATANNKIVDDSYPYRLSDLWEPPSRILRLREILGNDDLFTVQDFERLQNDMFSWYFRDMMPVILDACTGTALGVPDESRVFEYLHNWNFVLSKEDIASAIVNELLTQLLKNIYLDEMGEDLLNDFVLLANIPLRVTARLIQDGSSSWFDDVNTPEQETRGEIIRKSLREAVLALRERMGPETKAWRWGDLHTVTLQHPFGLQKPLDKVFNVGPFPCGGGPTSLVSAEYSFNKPFEVTVAASFRVIVDFARPYETRSVLPSGQSGQVFHDHYNDQTQLWLNGAYRTFRSDSASVVTSGWDHLVLESAP